MESILVDELEVNTVDETTEAELWAYLRQVSDEALENMGVCYE